MVRKSIPRFRFQGRKRFYFFFFQAEDGIRDHCVTGVQTCALPISVVKRSLHTKSLMRTVSKILAGIAAMTLASTAFAQTETETPSQTAPPGGEGRPGGQGGGGQRQRRPAGDQPVPFPRPADALERVTFRIRTMLSTPNSATNWINWRFAIASTGLGNLTLQEAVVRTDAAQVNFIEAS